MSTIQVEDEVKKQLFSIAAQLQSRRGKKASLNEAIKYLINIYRYGMRDIPRMLSLFACLSPQPKAHNLLKELRAEEEARLEKLERKYRA